MIWASRNGSSRTPALGLLVALGVTGSACQEEALTPLGAGGDAAGGGGGVTVTATTGSSGTGGAPAPDRGDPATFPTECVATCEEACAAIVGCGSESSPVHPIGEPECLARCQTAVSGPFWDDQSAVFRCCATQASCDAAAHCGGWLAHPDSVAPCEELCSCFASATVATLTAGRAAPAGYAFSRDTLFVVPARDAADLRRIPGIMRVQPGVRAIVTLGPTEGADTLDLLQRAGRVLPTFTDTAGRLGAATGRVIVRAGAGATLERAARVMRASKLGAGRKVRFASDLHLFEAADPWDAVDAVRAASAAGVDAELDMIRLYQHQFAPNDPLYEDQWHLANIGQGPSTRSVDTRVDEAWDVTRGDPAVVIAVNDDGVDLTHPDFAGKLLPELNFPADWQEQMAQGLFGSHGTSCAGVATAKGNNLFAGSGACADCSLLPHQLGPSAGGQFQVSDVEIAEGFEQMVDAGAWIISNSWGPSTGNPVFADEQSPQPVLPQVVKASFDYAETAGRGGLGTLIVFAAGNSNASLDGVGSYATNVTVGAVNDLGLKTYYSSFGPLLDVAAPSNGGLSGITTTAINGSTTASFGGTSSACPLVAGVLGLILSANPALTAAEARDILQTTTHKIDPIFGSYDVGGVSPFYGHGMVDAARAVRLASGLCADAASCTAPSDDCGGACGTLGPCDICRTTADCVSGSLCQALPSLGILTCVAPSAGGCPPGSTDTNGYCVPSPLSCGLCAPAETCNGRDDDCDGVADEDDVCGGAPLCFFEGPGCPAGMACAGTSCAPTCETTADCGRDEDCRPLKDAYGATSGARICAAALIDQCQFGCEVIASTLDDGPLADFGTCVEEAGGDCGSVFGCTSLLPIMM